MIYWISCLLLVLMASGLLCYGKFVTERRSQKERSIVYALVLFLASLIPIVNTTLVVVCQLGALCVMFVAAMQKFVYNEKSYTEYIKKILGA